MSTETPILANQANQLTLRQLYQAQQALYQQGIPLHQLMRQGLVRTLLAPDFNPADLAPLMTGPLDGVDPAVFVAAVGVLARADASLTTEDPTSHATALDVVGEVVRVGR
jgi:hypothetical protein